jgi:hypothetical protein
MPICPGDASGVLGAFRAIGRNEKSGLILGVSGIFSVGSYLPRHGRRGQGGIVGGPSSNDTAARVGAVAKLTVKNLVHDGSQYTLRFSEKGGKSREIPVRHDPEQLLLAYVQAAGITEGPLFRSANRRTRTLTRNAMTRIDVCRMMNRRLKAADLPAQFSRTRSGWRR